MLQVLGFNKLVGAGDACSTSSVPRAVFLVRNLQSDTE